jgi:hypothetical protein
MIQIQLQPEFEAQLAAEAQARGMALDRYIVEKLTESQPHHSQSGQHSITNAIQRIRELRQGNRLGGLRIKDLVHEGHKY